MRCPASHASTMARFLRMIRLCAASCSPAFPFRARLSAGMCTVASGAPAIVWSAIGSACGRRMPGAAAGAGRGGLQIAFPGCRQSVMEPVIDPAAVGLCGHGRGVPQADQLCPGPCDGADDLGERHLATADSAQVAALLLGTGSVIRPVVSSSMPCSPSRSACIAYLVW